MEYPLGDFLKDLRSRKGYTQEYVASCLGVSRQAYSNYENGVTEPSLATLSELISLYQIDVREIFMQGMGVSKVDNSTEELVLSSLEVNMINCMRKVSTPVQRQMYDYGLYLLARYSCEKKRKIS